MFVDYMTEKVHEEDLVCEELIDLKKQLEKCEKVLSFYADTKNWKTGSTLKVGDYKPSESNGLYYGGKRARTYFKEGK